MELADLIEGYKMLCLTSQIDPIYSETGRTVLLHSDGYVRVYLSKGPDNWDEISLEIEVFMGVGRSSRLSQSELIYDDAEDARISKSQLTECISYVEYMIRLEEAGFNLEFVLDGCIWTARHSIGCIPDSQLFRIITPPKYYDSGDRK